MNIDGVKNLYVDYERNKSLEQAKKICEDNGFAVVPKHVVDHYNAIPVLIEGLKLLQGGMSVLYKWDVAREANDKQ